MKGNKCNFTAIIRNYRGFVYQSDYINIDQFEIEMNKDGAQRSEICWARLFDKNGGRQHSQYKRGYAAGEEIPSL